MSDHNSFGIPIVLRLILVGFFSWWGPSCGPHASQEQVAQSLAYFHQALELDLGDSLATQETVDPQPAPTLMVAGPGSLYILPPSVATHAGGVLLPGAQEGIELFGGSPPTILNQTPQQMFWTFDLGGTGQGTRAHRPSRARQFGPVKIVPYAGDD